MSNNLHPVMADALAPWTPPRTSEEEARWVAADLARAAERARPDAEQIRADRIERRDAALECAMSGCWLPGNPL